MLQHLIYASLERELVDVVELDILHDEHFHP